MSKFPETIYAAAIDQQGDIDVLHKKEVPFPKVEPDHVVVKVAYAGVNFIDTYHRKGIYPIAQLPSAIGMEVSGTIAALPTDDKVLNDEQFKKRNLNIGDKVGVMSFGVHAEYISVPWTKLYSVPESVSLKTAAGALLQGLTALSFVTEAYKIQAGDIVFVHTIAGGLGLIFSQLAKARGATVIGTTSTEEKAAIAKQHGADHVILYTKENVVERVKELTNGEGVHVVYDGVGKDTFEQDFEIVRRKGTLVLVGNASGPVEPFAPLKLVGKNLKLLRPTVTNYLVTPSEVQYYGTELFKSIADGTVNIIVYKEYPFTTEGLREAQTDLTQRSGKTIGKLLIKIADE